MNVKSKGIIMFTHKLPKNRRVPHVFRKLSEARVPLKGRICICRDYDLDCSLVTVTI